MRLGGLLLDPVWPLWLVGLLVLVLGAGCVFLAVTVKENRWKWLCRTGALVLLALAFVRPAVPVSSTAHTAESAVDVFLVVDTSASMVAEDWGGQEPRLDGVKEDLDALIGQLPGARISMITFDSDAAVRVPLTTDHAAVRSAVDTLRPEITRYSGGSSVTAFTEVLRDRLDAAAEQNPANARVVYYFGDGEQTSQDSPASLAEFGSEVSEGAVFGYGTVAGGPMKETRLAEGLADPTGGGEGGEEAEGPTYIQDPATGKNAVSRIDEPQLRAMAGELGVGYVHRGAMTGFDSAYAAPTFETQLVEKEIAGGTREFFWIPLILVFGWIAAEAVFSLTRVRSLSTLGKGGPPAGRVRGAPVHPGATGRPVAPGPAGHPVPPRRYGA
ncbi:vWA domain-containing protein [Brevibacterium litoralis]|uniref:vWA domain-containing protein n=1 Tax=Brevibacterium litoralis TaxID=3138935 RepID=UPI0032EDFCD6